MFHVNDIVVYRRNVCQIIGTTTSATSCELCYVMKLYHTASSEVLMQVPISNKCGHLRRLSTKEEVETLLKKIPQLELLESKPANMKSQYVALLKGNDIEDLAKIIKTSYYRNQRRIDAHKKLASIDDEFFHKAENYLVNECSLVLGITYDECQKIFFNEIEKKPKA